MGSKILDIEEEFDPSLLGLGGPLSSGRQGVEVQDDQPSLGNGGPINHDQSFKKTGDTLHSHTLPEVSKPLFTLESKRESVAPVRKHTALELLRAISESHKHVIIHPESPVSNTNRSELASNTYHHTIPNLSLPNVKGDHEEPMARDFAEEDHHCDTHLEPSDLDKTESHTSITIPSAGDSSSIPETGTYLKRRPYIQIIRVRIPGSKKYRNAIRVYRPPVSSTSMEDTLDDTMDTSIGSIPEPDPEPDPEPEFASQFQKDIYHTSGKDLLDRIIYQSKLDSTSGAIFPSILRDLFPSLSDVHTTLKLINYMRRQLDLPLLDIKRINRIGFRKLIAKMREGLYIDLVSALVLPLAQNSPAKIQNQNGTDTENVTTDEEKIKVTLTPTNLKIMEKKLPKVFPLEKSLIKSFLADEHRYAYGEQLGHVVWQGGIAKIRGKGEGGFRGREDTEGDTHIYVDFSNILHGLLQHLYANPSDALPPRHLRTLSLPALSLLLRRGRYTPPGSLHLVASSPLQQNLDALVRLGWEISVLKRVELYEDEIEDSTSVKVINKAQTKLPTANANHVHHELGGGVRRYKEQGVDEILHLKILQILNEKDYGLPKPSKGNGNANTNTLVLATGDARGGQFNKDGFPGAVREAMKRGWNVELWSFTSGLSRAWREIAKRERWYEMGKFTIWALDDWAEQLVEVGEEPEFY